MSVLSKLSSIQLRVYAEIARASEAGTCKMPQRNMYSRCGLPSAYHFRKHVRALERYGLIREHAGCQGVCWGADLLYS